MDDTDDIQQWLDTELADLVGELRDVARSRWQILVATAVVCLGVVIGLAALLIQIAAGFSVPGFIIAFGLLIGPGVLVVVYAYVALVRNQLRYRFASDIVVPFYRQLYQEFRYDSAQGLDDELWKSTDWFEGDVEFASTTHRTHFRVGEIDIRFCHLKMTSPTSIARRIFGHRPNPTVDGIFAVIEGFDEPPDIELADVDGAQKRIDSDMLKVFVPAAHPTLRSDPRRDVVGVDEVRQFLDSIVDMTALLRRQL